MKKMDKGDLPEQFAAINLPLKRQGEIVAQHLEHEEPSEAIAAIHDLLNLYAESALELHKEGAIDDPFEFVFSQPIVRLSYHTLANLYTDMGHLDLAIEMRTAVRILSADDDELAENALALAIQSMIIRGDLRQALVVVESALNENPDSTVFAELREYALQFVSPALYDEIKQEGLERRARFQRQNEELNRAFATDTVDEDLFKSIVADIYEAIRVSNFVHAIDVTHKVLGRANELSPAKRKKLITLFQGPIHILPDIFERLSISPLTSAIVPKR